MREQRTRRAAVDVELAGVNISADISGDLISMTYSDKAAGEADDLSVTLQNRTGKWMAAWFPAAGDTIRARVLAQGWTGILDCGSFILDDVDFGGWPLTVSMKAVSMPADTNFSEVPRNRTWEGASLKDIAQSVADNAGVPLQYEASYCPALPFVSQTDKSDKVFL